MLLTTFLHNSFHSLRLTLASTRHTQPKLHVVSLATTTQTFTKNSTAHNPPLHTQAVKTVTSPTINVPYFLLIRCNSPIAIICINLLRYYWVSDASPSLVLYTWLKFKRSISAYPQLLCSNINNSMSVRSIFLSRFLTAVLKKVHADSASKGYLFMCNRLIY